MKTKQIVRGISKLVLLDLVLEIIYFPFWWYSFGVYKAGAFCVRQIKNRWRDMGFAINLKFLFKPMYAQHDFAGRVISFFARLIQLIFKLFLFLFIIIFFLIIFLSWIALPVFVIWQIKINWQFIHSF